MGGVAFKGGDRMEFVGKGSGILLVRFLGGAVLAHNPRLSVEIVRAGEC